MTRVPAHVRHIAIIMDGNGRWARSQGYARTFGHIKGARVAKRIITHAAKLGLSHLTLFAFSTENWLRPKEEVTFLMGLLDRHLKKEKSNLVQQNIKFQVVGNLDKLPEKVRKTALETVRATAECSGLTLTFAISYGGRQDVADACRSIAEDIERGEMTSEQVSEATIHSRLTNGISLPDPDLILRTSGEQRLSNFMLWQAAYSEFLIVEKHWPDFTEADFENAISELLTRERRFGGVSSAPSKDSRDESSNSNVVPLFQ